MNKAALIILMFISFPVIRAQNEKTITILHTNDLHSHLVGFAPESSYSPEIVNNDNTRGGFARIASIIREEKNKDNGITLVLDAGDFLMGTLFQTIETENGFQLSLMKEIGFDVTCFGNHEFDFGPGKLAQIISSSAMRGKIPAILMDNVEFSSGDTADDGLEKLYSEGIIKRKVILDKEGIRIGIFSLLGKDAVDDAPKAFPVTFSKQISYARKMVDELKQADCNVIICLSHSGVALRKNGEWGGEDVELAHKVKGIDVIISGHTHTRLDQPIMVDGVPVVQTGAYGENVGRLTLSYSSGKVQVKNYSLIPVNDEIKGDESVVKKIDIEKVKIDTEVLIPIGLKYNMKIAETDFKLEGNETGDFLESNLGPLVADAIRFYVNRHCEAGTDISMVAAGVIRDNISPGLQETSDIFRVMSLGSGNDNVPGYPLSRLFVTGKELKSILEILQIAYKSKPDNYCYYSGIRVQYDPGKGLFRKIKKVEIEKPDGNFINVDLSKRNKTLYSVTANSYMLEYFGIIKKMSFGLINVIPKDQDGVRIADMKNAVIDMNSSKSGIQEGKEWLALLEYLGSMKDSNGDGIPDIDNRYAKPVKCFYLVK